MAKIATNVAGTATQTDAPVTAPAISATSPTRTIITFARSRAIFGPPRFAKTKMLNSAKLEGNPAAGCLITSLVNQVISGTRIATRAARRRKMWAASRCLGFDAAEAWVKTSRLIHQNQ